MANQQGAATTELAHDGSQSCWHCFVYAIYGGGLATKVFKATILGASFGVIASFTFLSSHNLGWTIGAATLIFVNSLIAMVILHILSDKITASKINAAASLSGPEVSFRQMSEFWLTAWKRKRYGLKNFNHVHTAPNGTHIFLGALPNKNDPPYLHFMKRYNVRSVLSVNEPWERTNFASSAPFTRDDWEANGINYYTINAKDHLYLNFDQLNDAADYIRSELQAGKNILSHCKSGMGRSAMAVAAYMIKYEGMTPDAVAAQIEHGDEEKKIEGRPISTIIKKIERHPSKGEGLISYAERV
mmetsp:Transcript_5985/g.12533  ORF Transcript_5985/g.12533 Transcript_5985/m.12533 type:complete len:301 (-) Transcript_5985:164-1066(-)